MDDGNKPMLTVESSRDCQQDRCAEPPSCVAAAHEHETPKVYCERHGYEVIPRHAEYIAKCPNCGCEFGVG